jgi:hypothetical protein
VEQLIVWSGGRRKLLKDEHFGPWVDRVGPIRVAPVAAEPFFYLALRRGAEG